VRVLGRGGVLVGGGGMIFKSYVHFTRDGGVLVAAEQSDSEGDAYTRARDRSRWPEGATAAHIYRELVGEMKALVATFTQDAQW
jgi:hypothetical protein